MCSGNIEGYEFHDIDVIGEWLYMGRDFRLEKMREVRSGGIIANLSAEEF